MTRLGVIGGTGLDRLADARVLREERVETPFGTPSDAYLVAELAGCELVFLARHGSDHHIPPHRINYRANLWGFQQLDIDTVIAFAAVGGVSRELRPAQLVIPHQIIDYTWGRAHSFEEGDSGAMVNHIDFTDPYCSSLRQRLLSAAGAAGVDYVGEGVYGATQGPRLETAAEIDRMARDGCTIVGMTGMPEVALARELGLCYATLAVVANPAAGRGPGEIRMSEIEAQLALGVKGAVEVLKSVCGGDA